MTPKEEAIELVRKYKERTLDPIKKGKPILCAMEHATIMAYKIPSNHWNEVILELYKL